MMRMMDSTFHYIGSLEAHVEKRRIS